MDSQEVLSNGTNLKSRCISSYGNGLVHDDNGSVQVVEDEGNGTGNPAQDFLEDFEEYLDDINDRLMVSRMVSDSVIKGMVTAVEQESAEKIAAKELEVANLKKFLQSFGACDGMCKGGNLPVESFHTFSSFTITDACERHEQMRKDVGSCKKMAMEKFESAIKDIQCAVGCNSVKRICSGPELTGLSEILHDKQSENLMHVSSILESLKTTVGTICDNVDCVLVSSEMSLHRSLEEQDLCAEIEGMVMQSILRMVQEDIEEKMWEHNAQFTRIQNVNWLEKFNAISSLGIKLDAILKSLSLHEAGPVSHGSHDLDNLHQRPFGNHVVPTDSLREENGLLEAFTTHVPESYDLQQLKHMTREELVNYFNGSINKMRRDHESALQQQTEEYFRLKREYLKEKGSVTTHRKDEEFDVLRKKIPEVISKVEDFLSENERFPALSYSIGNIGNLEDRLESLLSENSQLRDCLADKQNKPKAFETQSSVEKDMFQLLENLKSTVEDVRTEASVSEEVYKCFLRELFRQLRSNCEDSEMKSSMMQETFEIILRQAAVAPETSSKWEVDNLDFDSLILQDLRALIYTESIKDIGQKLKERRIYLEKTAREKEDKLKLVTEEKEKLEQQILGLETTMEQKEKLLMDLSVALSKEKEQFKVVSRELASVREDASQQQKLIDNITRESELVRTQLTEAKNQIEANKLEMHQLRGKLDEAQEVLAEAEKDKNLAFARVQEMHDRSESGGERLKKDLQVAVSSILGLSEAFDNFEWKISGAIKENSLRLDNTSSQLKALRKTELLYQQRLARKSADLQKAEDEVDLLGDEVDALLRLLDKIYIALDHYLPILKHYPGIVEILELVRRELSGDSIKPL